MGTPSRAEPEPERITPADLRLKARMEAEAEAAVTYAQRLAAFVAGHLAKEYGLTPGDTVEDDGRITRAVPAPDPEGAA